MRDDINTIKLNFPNYHFRITEKNGSRFIFDINRKKFVPLTPEEWVRQHLLSYLIAEQKLPAGLITTEVAFSFNQVSHRADLVVYNQKGNPILLAECKAPSVEITHGVIEQIARYNYILKAQYLLVTNGIKHQIFDVSGNEKWKLLNEFPNLSAKL